MKHGLFYALLSLSALFVASCSKDADVWPPVISGIENNMSMIEGSKLELTPVVQNADNATFSWLVDGLEVSTAIKYTFAPSAPGTYVLTFTATNSGGSDRVALSVTVLSKTNSYEVPANSILSIDPSAVFGNKNTVEWTITQSASPLHRLSKNEEGKALFIAAKEGLYTVSESDGKSAVEINIIVTQRQSSPYIARVFDYLPAPGQYVNELPKYSEGDTRDDMIGKASEYLVGEDALIITLGGWGGYVTFGFDHTIVNVEGKRDFRVLGNAFATASSSSPGESSEPGIVMVAYDKNKNGKPDADEWYEINGSGNFSAKNETWYQMAVNNNNDVRTFRDYEMTYFRPSTEVQDETGTVDNPNSFTTISKYIRWTDNKGQEGYKIKNVYHAQSYYPAWVTDDALTYSGIRLADNSIDEGGIGNHYMLYAYRYGYADNYSNTDDHSGIDIDWAIDKNGNRVVLPGIDFVKVYNGINKENGWQGETSTEVGGAQDLHLLGKSIDTVGQQ